MFGIVVCGCNSRQLSIRWRVLFVEDLKICLLIIGYGADVSISTLSNLSITTIL